MNNEIDQVIVINLKIRVDRKDHIKEVLNKMNIPQYKIMFLEATTSDDDSWKRACREIGCNYDHLISRKFLDLLSSPDPRVVKHTRSKIGCFLSHMRAWKIVERLNKKTLILEDDACLTKQWYNPNSVRLIKHVNDYEFIYLGDNHREDKDYTLPIVIGDQQLIRRQTLCLHAYLITSQCVKKVHSFTPIDMPVDTWCKHFLINNNIKFYIFDKSLIIQSGFSSNIDPHKNRNRIIC